MKRFVICFLMLSLVLGLSLPIAAQKTYVLITGVSNYPNEEDKVGQTTKDAKNLAKFWKRMTPNVTLLTSAYVTTDNITKKLTEICEAATEKDIIVFYYAGHGVEDYLYIYDGVYPYHRLLKILNASKAKAKICLVNACHSGSIQKAAKQNDSPAYALFSSSRSNEVSYEASILGAGYFSQALLKGLRGAADKNKDKLVTVKELYEYAHADVPRRSKGAQHPQLYAHSVMHDFVLVDWNK